MTVYQPCTAILERRRCVFCGAEPSHGPQPDAMAAHLEHCPAAPLPGPQWYDAVAPADAGTILCLDCIPAEDYTTMPDPDYPDLRGKYSPLEESDHADSYCYCDQCLRPLTYHRLTRDGTRYEAEHALERGDDATARGLLAQVAEDSDPDSLLDILEDIIRDASPETLETIAAHLTDYEPGARQAYAERRRELDALARLDPRP